MTARRLARVTGVSKPARCRSSLISGDEPIAPSVRRRECRLGGPSRSRAGASEVLAPWSGSFIKDAPRWHMSDWDGIIERIAAPAPASTPAIATPSVAGLDAARDKPSRSSTTRPPTATREGDARQPRRASRRYCEARARRRRWSPCEADRAAQNPIACARKEPSRWRLAGRRARPARARRRPPVTGGAASSLPAFPPAIIASP